MDKQQLEHYLKHKNKHELFVYLDKLRKEKPAEYQKFLTKHETDLREVGFFSDEM